MWADSTQINAVTKTSSRVGLTFNHALTKIIVNLTAGNGLQESDITGSTVTLHAMKTIAINNGVAQMTTGESPHYDASSLADITMGSGATSHAAIMVPQSIAAASAFITVTTSGSHAVTYSLADAKTFLPGKVYIYNLRVDMAAITLQSTEINDWVDGDDSHPTAGTVEI